MAVSSVFLALLLAPIAISASGDNCDPDPCEHGTCIDEEIFYICECHPGYEGDRCEKDINDCDPNPCHNGGSCIDKVDNYKCRCPEGYIGVNCDTETPNSSDSDGMGGSSGSGDSMEGSGGGSGDGGIYEP